MKPLSSFPRLLLDFDFITGPSSIVPAHRHHQAALRFEAYNVAVVEFVSITRFAEFCDPWVRLKQPNLFFHTFALACRGRCYRFFTSTKVY
ncbi:hypothetical protein SBA3_4220030 [Candidatus Sulfopaludibacter sp. SbA3]|nr:hypothetical protein SBA3_4220030 [Candidatus Sulfopaludibacter sp. SbA3]